MAPKYATFPMLSGQGASLVRRWRRLIQAVSSIRPYARIDGVRAVRGVFVLGREEWPIHEIGLHSGYTKIS